MSGLAPAALALPKQLGGLAVGTFVTLQKVELGGALQARRLSSGTVQFYWRYANEGRTHREPIGTYDPLSPPKKLEPTTRGMSIAAAREHCRQLAIKHAAHRGIGGLPEAKAAERKRYLAEQEASAERARHSLAGMLDDYVKHQATQGRVSAREAKNIFDRHVVQAWPTLAATPACEITQEHVIDILRRLTEQDKGRTANKVRTYLRAAFQCAVDVRVSASIPVAFKPYGVQANPVAHTRRDSRFDCADKRPFGLDELRTYWQLIENVPGIRGRCLRMHLLTGGQRIEQLVRLRWADVRSDSITIFDNKGRPGRGPRTHVVPIIRPALRDLQAFEREGDFVFSTKHGVKHISGTTLSGWAAQAAGGAIRDFQLKRGNSPTNTVGAGELVQTSTRC